MTLALGIVACALAAIALSAAALGVLLWRELVRVGLGARGRRPSRLVLGKPPRGSSRRADANIPPYLPDVADPRRI
jgi:hypothetical protein